MTVLSETDIQEAFDAGLTALEALDAKSLGLSIAEAKTAKGLRVSFADYARRRPQEPTAQDDAWRKAEQAAMMRGLANAAGNAGTEAAARLAKFAAEGVPERGPVAWWGDVDDSWQKAAYARAKAKGGAAGLAELKRLHEANCELVRQGRRPVHIIPKRLR